MSREHVVSAGRESDDKGRHSIETSFLLIKPDGVQKDAHFTAKQLLEDANLHIVAIHERRLTREMAEKLYRNNTRISNVWGDVIAHLTSGLSIILVVKGEGAIQKTISIKGKRGGKEGLRPQFATSLVKNAVHCPDTADDYEQERQILEI